MAIKGELAAFASDTPPPKRKVWVDRFAQIEAEGLTGKWINASKAWNIGPGLGSIVTAAAQAGVKVSTRTNKGDLWICVEGSTGRGRGK
jgi:hypothetical protein